MTAPEKVMMPRWRCVHCRRSWANRKTALAHAARCWYDPANRGCATCEHYKCGYAETAVGYVRDEHCAVGMVLPVLDAIDGPRPTLAVHCQAHRVREAYINPDVIDFTVPADDASH